ncbi:MAG: stage 0 sporulation family protein [Isosphaeraceae bacterium]
MPYVVRYGRMRFLGEYAGPEDQELFRGQRVVIRTDRGTELGEILCPATERTAGYLEQSVPGEILRPAAPEDLEQEATLVPAQQKAFDVCQELIARRRLQMDLVDVEIILGRERIVFYYLAEKRVDFRELVKDLARALRTRIEMRQIGVRDEAKLLADYGDCGKPVCCNTHLTAMPPVSMKMAKLQKTTLDPAKISGRCGRLKCCLRYEFDTYRDLERQLPAFGSQVVTSKGRGRVVGQEILAQKLVLEFEDHRRIIIGAGDVLSVEPPRSRQAHAGEPTGPKSGRSHRDGLEDQFLQELAGADAAWSHDGSIDEAEPETQAEDDNDLGPNRRDRRGG